MRKQPCPKCGTIRRADDLSPNWQCPTCGIAYNKFSQEKHDLKTGTLLQDNPERSTISISSSQPKITSKTIRITILLVVLFFVATDAWLKRLRSTDWDLPLWVVVYPINGDGSKTSFEYIQALQESDFELIERFMAREAERYHLQIKNPITVKLAPEVKVLPPESPKDGSLLKTMWWSLKLRYWAYFSDNFEGPPPNIKIFAVYFDPKTHATLEHSIGLEKGLIGIANVFASSIQVEQNNVVIAHEMLHTVGATDKYDFETHQPVYPAGYVEPNKEPLFPQEKAEIMGGRIPISNLRSILPRSLSDVVIEEKTGQEIRWIE